MEAFDVALAAFVEGYRNKVDKAWVVKLLHNQAEQTDKDDKGWVFDGNNNPQPVSPTLGSISPNTAVIGGEDVTMVCNGTDFTSASVITFNGGDEPTTFISENQVSTIVKPSTAGTPGAYPVTVKNSTLESDPVEFTFTEAAGRK